MAARKEDSRETFLVRRVMDVMRDAGFRVEETRAGMADLSATKADFLGRRHVSIGCYREVRTQRLNSIKARWESQRPSGESNELWIVADTISATARTLSLPAGMRLMQVEELDAALERFESGVFAGTQRPRPESPAPDPSLVGGPTVAASPLVVREGESLTVTEPNPPRLRANAYERVGSAPHKEIALIQLRGLIEACDEAVNFNRTRNVRPPYLWLDDKQYLAELRDILIELRRLNNFLEASSSTEPTVLKSVNKTASRFGQFIDAYASEMGKGAAQLTKGAMALGLVYAGVGDAALAKLLGK